MVFGRFASANEEQRRVRIAGNPGIISYLGVGLHLSARRLPPPLLRPCFVALLSGFVEGAFIPFPESTA